MKINGFVYTETKIQQLRETAWYRPL